MTCILVISFLIALSGAFAVIGAYAAYYKLKLVAVLLVAASWMLALEATCIGIDFGRIRGYVDSGKYEIVTNNDYSLKELKTFKKVGNVYLKEVE